MDIVEELFNKYTELRVKGEEIQAVYDMMQDDVMQKCTRQQRSILSGKCEQWERDGTIAELTPEQQEVLHSLTNVTVRIVFCSVCDSPNTEGFLRCQVCDAPLAFELQESAGTTDMTVPSQGAHYDKDSQLIFKAIEGTARLVLQPQMTPLGLKIGRRSGQTPPDVDLTGAGIDGKGISRIHAVVRYDKQNNHLMLKDASSTNGTFINGVRLEPEMDSILADGDEVKFGRLKFRVKIKVSEGVK